MQSIYLSEEYGSCTAELFVSVSVWFSPSSVCSKGDDRGVHWGEGQLLHLILFLTSVSLSLLHTQLQVRYAAGNWTLLIQFKSTHRKENNNKKTDKFRCHFGLKFRSRSCKTKTQRL